MRKQHGYPGHFIASASCLFHLHTTCGSFRVSTVGDYHPAYMRGPGDALGERQPIGHRRYFETYVFLLGADGEPASWSEVDARGYDDAEAAEAGHEQLCAKYEKLTLDVRGLESAEDITHVLSQLQAPALADTFEYLVRVLEDRRDAMAEVV